MRTSVSRRRELILSAILLALAWTIADHGFRKDDGIQCHRSDRVECPRSLWWFSDPLVTGEWR